MLCEVDINAVHGQTSPSKSVTLGNILQLEEEPNFEDSLDFLPIDSIDKCSLSSYSSLRENEDQLSDDFLDGCTLLHLACQTADIGMVELLLQHGAYVNAPDMRGQTSLHHSIIRGRTGIAKLLLTR